MFATPDMFVIRADSSARAIDDLEGKPVAFGAQGLGPGCCSRRRRCSMGSASIKDPRLRGDLPRPGWRRTGDGDERQGGGALGRRHRLARLRGRGQGASRRAVHRAGRGGHRAHPGQAPVAQDAHRACRLLPRTDRADRLRGLVELHPGAPDAARRRRLPAGARAAQGRGGGLQGACRRPARRPRPTPRPRRRSAS